MPKLSLSTNFDTATRYFANYINQYLKSYPNPNNLQELDMCDKQVVEIARSEEETSKIMNSLNNKINLLPVVVVEQKGDVTFKPKSRLEAKLLNPITLRDKTKFTETLTLRGKSTDYKSSFKIHIVTRSLISAREISMYLTELLFDSTIIRYPAFIKDIEENIIYSEVGNFGHFRILNSEISFTHESLEESNIYRMTSDLEFSDSNHLYSNFIVNGQVDNIALRGNVKRLGGMPNIYQDEISIIVVSEDESLLIATNEDIENFKSRWGVPNDKNIMFYRELNATYFFYLVNDKPVLIGFRELPTRKEVSVYEILDSLEIRSFLVKRISNGGVSFRECLI